MIKLIYTNISGETTLKNPYKTNFTLSHKPGTWLVSSNNNKHTNIHKINYKVHIQDMNIQEWAFRHIGVKT